jgi:iron complex outermembrane receptor protein
MSTPGLSTKTHITACPGPRPGRNNLRISPHWTGSFTFGGLRNDLTLGARYFAGTNSALQFVNIGSNRGAPTANERQNAQNYDAYLDNRLWLTPELALMTGVKLFHSERDFQNRFTVPFRNASREYDGFNPRSACSTSLPLISRSSPT